MPKVPLFEPSPQDWSPLINQRAPLVTGPQIFAKGMMGLGDALSKHYNIIQSRKDKLFLLSKQNRIQQQRVDDLLNVREQFKEEGAQKLVETETERINNQRNEFLDDVRPDLKGMATQLYNSANAQYLGRVASHEYAEYESWRNTQLTSSVTTAHSKAKTLDPGDIQGLFGVAGELRGKLINEPISSPTHADVHGKDVVLQTYAFWARLNPEIAEDILVKHGPVLQEVMGRDYNKMLVALQTGKRIFEQERESNYKWAKRKEVEEQEDTMKSGLELWVDPGQRITETWILSSKDKLSSTHMRILNNLIKVQDVIKPLTLPEVNWGEYYRLSALVRTQKSAGYSTEFIAEEISNQIEGTITSELGKQLLNTLAKGRELTPQQQRAYKLIDSIKYDNNSNRNAAFKAMHTSRLDKWIVDNPGEDPVKGYLKDTLFEEHKDDLIQSYVETYRGPDTLEAYDEGYLDFAYDEAFEGIDKAFVTPDENTQITRAILHLQRNNPEEHIKDTPEVRDELLKLYRMTYPTETLKYYPARGREGIKSLKKGVFRE